MTNWEANAVYIRVPEDEDDYDGAVSTSLLIEEEANRFGQEGWKLVGVASHRDQGFMLTFKRPIE
jgi:hypothetical protein